MLLWVIAILSAFNTMLIIAMLTQHGDHAYLLDRIRRNTSTRLVDPPLSVLLAPRKKTTPYDQANNDPVR